MRRRPQRLLPFIAAVLTAACAPSGVGESGDTDGAGDARPGDEFSGDATESTYLPADEYCESIADALCEFYLRCGRMNVADHEACLSLTLESCNLRWEPRYVQLAEAGLLRLSRAGVHTCSAYLSGVECAYQTQELRGPCAAMWEGRQAAGEPCSIFFGGVESYVCAPGTTCVLSMTMCGTCETTLAAGSSCPVAGSTCSPVGDCEGGLCVDRKLYGEPCGTHDSCELGGDCLAEVCEPLTTFVGPGDPCGPRERCPYGTLCIAGVCELAARIGEDCATAPCATGYCIADDLCGALLPSGTGCDDDDQCATGRCEAGNCATLPSACF